MRKFVTVASVVLVLAMVAVMVDVISGRMKPDTAQSVSASLILLATLLYVILTGETLQVLKQQTEMQKKTVCRFGLTKREEKAFVWVANLGFSSFLVNGIDFLAQANSPISKSTHKHRVVAVGERKLFEVPEELYLHAALRCEVAVNLAYMGPDEVEYSAERSFLLLVSDGKIVKIKRAAMPDKGKAPWAESQ
jgi:hypothetical protein